MVATGALLYHQDSFWGYDARFWEITPKSGSHVTHRWSKRDSNRRSPKRGMRGIS